MIHTVHLVTDYDAAACAEVAACLGLVSPDTLVCPTTVRSRDTLAAGFCVAHLALAVGPPQRLVVHDVDAPDGFVRSERFWMARTRAGVLAVGPNAGWCWSFVADAVRGFWCLDVPATTRSVGPLAIAAAHALAAHPHAVERAAPRGDIPALPEAAIAYADAAGNLKTTITSPPADPGQRVRVRVGDVDATAVVADGEAAPAGGTLVLAPAADRRPLLELSMPGASAAELFAHPPNGTPVTMAPLTSGGTPTCLR